MQQPPTMDSKKPTVVLTPRRHMIVIMYTFNKFGLLYCGIKLYQNKDHVNVVPDGLVYRGHQQLEQFFLLVLRAPSLQIIIQIY